MPMWQFYRLLGSASSPIFSVEPPEGVQPSTRWFEASRSVR